MFFLIKKNGNSEDFDCKIGSKCAETSNCCNNCGQFPRGGGGGGGAYFLK